MSSGNIIVFISDDGDIEVSAEGIAGEACLEATAEVEAALGTVTRREHTPEFDQRVLLDAEQRIQQERGK